MVVREQVPVIGVQWQSEWHLLLGRTESTLHGWEALSAQLQHLRELRLFSRRVLFHEVSPDYLEMRGTILRSLASPYGVRPLAPCCMAKIAVEKVKEINQDRA